MKPPTEMFAKMCVAAGLPEPVPEFKFHPTRKWRFDWAFTEAKVALEMEGLGGRHQRMGGFIKDMEKYSEAAILGWRVLRCTVRQFETGEVFTLLKRIFQ